MATTSRGESWIYVTWLTKLLSGDDQCAWAAWFKSHFKFDKVQREFDVAAWSAAHNDMLRKRVAALTADGWMCFLEDQNAFRLQGEIATLAGKPDIVAVRDQQARVIDCKAGQRRDSDLQQVLVYLQVLPLTCKAVKGCRLTGELQYTDGSVVINPEELTPDVRNRIIAAIRSAGGAEPPARVPSFRECRFCDISSADCPDRVEKKQQVSAAGMF